MSERAAIDFHNQRTLSVNENNMYAYEITECNARGFNYTNTARIQTDKKMN